MNEQELVIYLLGKSEIDKYKKDNAISDLCERHNNLLKQNHDLLIENELANKDAKQLRERLEGLIARCGVDQ